MPKTQWKGSCKNNKPRLTWRTIPFQLDPSPPKLVLVICAKTRAQSKVYMATGCWLGFLFGGRFALRYREWGIIVYKRTSHSSNTKSHEIACNPHIKKLINWFKTCINFNGLKKATQYRLRWINNKSTGGQFFYVRWMRGTFVHDNFLSPYYGG